MGDDVNFGFAKIINVDNSIIPMKKFTVPEIAPEEMTPKAIELLAIAEQLVSEANHHMDEIERLKREVAQLKANKKWPSHVRR